MYTRSRQSQNFTGGKNRLSLFILFLVHFRCIPFCFLSHRVVTRTRSGTRAAMAVAIAASLYRFIVAQHYRLVKIADMDTRSGSGYVGFVRAVVT